MSIRAVIFDFGGVLVRTEDREPRERLAARLAMTYEELDSQVFDSPSALAAAVGEASTRQHWQATGEALGLSRDEIAEVRQQFSGGDALDEELVVYVRSLRPDYKTALLSNAFDDLRAALVEDWKIADAFDEIVISAEVGVAKPDPAIYEIALERLGVAPQEAVFVDDFPENVEGARAAGMRAIRFKNSRQVREALDDLLNEMGHGCLS